MGVAGITVDAIVVTVTIIGGYWLGKALKMDKDIALLTSVGAGICGAAAVLGAEATLRTKPYKTAVAVATVVIFGTLSMFLYPILWRSGILHLTPEEMGIWSGSTLHEVAHAVGAGNAMGEDIAKITVIVKMIRVMMLVPVLLVLGWWIATKAAKALNAGKASEGATGGKVAIPWFAFLFLVVIGVNSFIEWLVPGFCTSASNGVITHVDTFLLTMAMVALGAETSIDKFKKAGAKPFLLAFLIYVWLLAGGYSLARWVSPLML